MMVIQCAGCSTEVFKLARVYQILNARFIFENLRTYCEITVLIILNTPLILQQKVTHQINTYTKKNTLSNKK
jgi:hypothetical protein